MAGNGSDPHLVTTLAQLEALYDKPFGGSMVKEIDHVNAHYRAFIEAAPFFAMATSGPDGLDCYAARRSAGLRARRRREDAADPRPARQQPHRQPAQPHRRSPHLAAVPDPGLRRNHPRQRPRRDLDRSGAVQELRLQRQDAAQRPRRHRGALSTYQCPKAIVRSKLWDPATQVDRKSLPTSGTILAGITNGAMGGPEHDRTAPERLKATIY